MNAIEDIIEGLYFLTHPEGYPIPTFYPYLKKGNMRKFKLSKNEQKVYPYIFTDTPNKLAAQELGITQNHYVVIRFRLCKKLGRNRIQLLLDEIMRLSLFSEVKC